MKRSRHNDEQNLIRHAQPQEIGGKVKTLEHGPVGLHGMAGQGWHDGRVLGDSGVDRSRLDSLENHAGRPEVRDALRAERASQIRRQGAADGEDPGERRGRL